mmetsp:Transcript_4742/g.7201  ORF Transcript_4742/g.7201 Transcript_4742/m.7201 type:complete len:565 (+) Transcript_4742:214-1908(+)|eukprot:CAMPEP_0196801802 /NCGR_PEP_ID=MMETSP1362-20130617/1585_1 /TAXON_ID=163516 /ORGANISM="Leptocylindrus danicus, Strain CCMP1856" /LENGTH=564 /DNA_ID=CAMNT_0042172943 /DNA_START=192 /DNA_END=1886 /DNA_ORIENTATION=-
MTKETTATTSSDNKTVLIIPAHSKLRDEFTCPITREIISEPVIAADGHTYDKSAIEQWIHFMQNKLMKPTSPKTGEELEHLHLIPNHNLKRLLRDMLVEGRGDALYQPDADAIAKQQESASSDKDAQSYNCDNDSNGDNVQTTVDASNSNGGMALVREKVLNLKCLGPNESEWNNRSFKVTESGCIGGRRRPTVTAEKQNDRLKQLHFIQFTEATVSRRHFEICYDKNVEEFRIRDLGSAGGTFVRIPPGKSHAMAPGTMIMVGKHQLVAEKFELSSDAVAAANQEEIAGSGDAVVGDVDEDVQRLNDRSSTSPGPDRQQQQQQSSQMPAPALTPRNDVAEDQEEKPMEAAHEYRHLMDHNEETDCNVLQWAGMQKALSNEGTAGDDCASVRSSVDRDQDSMSVASAENNVPVTQSLVESSCNFVSANNSVNGPPVLMLRCFAPEGTPIQNKEYPISKKGATLGRKQSNTISFSHEVNGNQVGIDSSVSGEHAKLKYNENTKLFELSDGVGVGKCSTNGTWVRLSGMHKESNFYAIENQTELLFGTVRFQVSIDEQVVERELPH